MNRLVYLMGIAGIASLVSCSGGSGEKETGGSGGISSECVKQVRTVKVEWKALEGELTLTGKVEYNPDKIIRYVPLTSGVIDRIYFSTGDKVQEGQVLFDLRSTELSRLSAEEVSLESEAGIAEREMKTVRSLYEDDMTSEKDLLEARAKLDQVNASLKRIRTDMSFYRHNAEKGTFSVIAPMSGYIVERNVSSGSTVSSGGEPVFTIADLSTVWIMANVYAKDLLSVKEGMEVEIELLSYPDRVFNGKISKLSNVFDSEEHTLKARILMDNSALLFKPEMSAVIRLKNRTARKMLAVPSEALIFDSNCHYVVVGKSDDDYEIRKVTVGRQNNGVTYIHSGLKEGEDILVKNQLLVYSQLK